jgi:hypothetical protein
MAVLHARSVHYRTSIHCVAHICLGEKMSGTCCVRVRSCAGFLHTQALSLGPFLGQAGPLEAGRRAA